MLSEKVIIIHFIVGWINLSHTENKIEVELNFSNYAKTNLMSVN